MLLSAPHDNRLDRIYEELRPELLRFFRRRHGSDEAAQDLLQETFAAVLRNPARLFAADSPRAYLFGVARHVSADALRRARPTEPLHDEDEALIEGGDEDPRLETMREAMAGLDPALRRLLHLRLREELSYEEIAGALNVPIGTVRSRLHYTVRRLAAAIQSNQRL